MAGRSENILVAVISDGAGSAERGKSGSAIACRSVSESARAHFKTSDDPPTDDQIWAWIDQARDRIGQAAAARDLTLRDFAATLICVLATDTETVVLHIGDGAAVCQVDGQWLVPSWPANGEYASTTYFITDDPSPKLNIVRLARPVDSVALFSDGIERLALQFSDQTAHAPFFESLTSVLRRASAGPNPQLNASLRRYLAGERINERTDDDKSLALGIRL